MIIKIPMVDDEEMFVNTIHIVSIMPVEKEDYCCLTLVNDDEGVLVPLSVLDCVAHIALMSGGSSYK